MIPDSTHIGTSDVETWQAVPAENNLSGDELGSWAVVAGDGEEADVYLDVTAEYPKRVAEFVVAAIRGEAARRRFAGASDDIAAELDRQRQPASGPLAATRPYLPDTMRLALLVERLGDVASHVTAQRGDCRSESAKRLYEDLTQLAAVTVGWMETLLARGGTEPEG
jgi:hypothetical protein